MRATITRRDLPWRTIARILLALFYALAGIMHIVSPDPFVRVTPAWVPHAREIILLTGVCELAGAAALLTHRLRRLAGAMLMLYALCVYPANIQHAVQDLSTGTGLGWAYHYPRLFLQPLLCWWALWAGGLGRPQATVTLSRSARRRRDGG